MRSWFVVAVICMSMLGAPIALPDARAAARTIAVIYPNVPPGGTSLGIISLTSRIQDDLSRSLPSDEFEVLSEESWAKDSRGWQSECLEGGEDCDIALGMRIGVDLLITGQVSSVRGHPALKLRLYDVYQSQRIGQELLEASDTEGILNAWKPIVRKWVALLMKEEGASPAAGLTPSTLMSNADTLRGAVTQLTGDKIEVGGNGHNDAPTVIPDTESSRSRRRGFRAHEPAATAGGVRGSVDKPDPNGASPAFSEEDSLPRNRSSEVNLSEGAGGSSGGGGTTTGNPRADSPTQSSRMASGAGTTTGNPRTDTTEPSGKSESTPASRVEVLRSIQATIKSEEHKTSGPGVRGAVDQPNPNGASSASETVGDSAGTVQVASGMAAAVRSGTGTGFALSPRLIITNAHVVGQDSRMVIRDQQGVQRLAMVIGRDTTQDLAVLEIADRESALTYHLSLARAALGEFAKAGQRIFVLGYPLPSMLGKDIVITEGIVNSRSGMQGDSTFFQMSVPIQPGNSGSPVISERGHVVGIVSSSLRSTGLLEKKGVVAQNVNFAIKSNMLVEVFPWLLKKLPRSQVRQSYFEHMSAEEEESGSPNGIRPALTAEDIVSQCAAAVVKILPLKP